MTDLVEFVRTRLDECVFASRTASPEDIDRTARASELYVMVHPDFDPAWKVEP